jgi:DNA-binding MarR family transcriptional regulator
MDSESIAFELNSVAIHLVRRLRQADLSLGVSAARLSALSVLVFGGPRTITELAAAEQVAQPTMTRLVAALEQEGWVARSAHPDDGRAVVIEATAAGRKLLERGRRQRVERLAAELDSLSPREQDTLARAARILRRLEGSPPPG